MKKYLYIYISAIVSLSSCQGPIVNGSGIPIPQEVKPISVQVASGDVSNIQSYQATIKRFVSDSRRSNTQTLESSFKLSVRINGNQILTRLDYPGSEYLDGRARSLINDGEFVSTIVTGSNEVLGRKAVPEELSAMTRKTNDFSKGLFTRINVSEMVGTFKRLNYKIEPGKHTGENFVFTPEERLSSLFPGKKVLSYKLILDENIGAITGSQIVEMVSDDEKLSTNTSEFYMEKDGVPVKVGQVVEEVHSIASRIDTSDSEYPGLTDPESVRMISQEELTKIEAEGAISYVAPPPVADPGSKDYTTTRMEVYETVDINSVPESFFRIGL